MKQLPDRPEVGKQLSQALRSRRARLALATLLVALAVMVIPKLETVQDELMTLMMAVLLALVGDYTVRDAGRIGHEHGRNGYHDEPNEDIENDEVMDV